MDTLLDVRDLTLRYPVRRGSPFAPRRYVNALNGVNLSLRRGATLGIVGESGCGKTTLAKCILRLLEPQSGTIRFQGQDITHLSGAALRAVRSDMQPIFQDPYSCLDPRLRAREIVREPLDALSPLTRQDADAQALALLGKVGLTRQQAENYPHQFSGGQRQRIGIARALALRPALILADEPVSALDVSVRAQILNLLMDLKAEFGLSYIVISHDLAVIEHICDEVAIIYLGRIVEHGPAERIFRHPAHPYTRSLLDAVPHPTPLVKHRTAELSGEPPDPTAPPAGCSFHPRCPLAIDICRRVAPPEVTLATGHVAACHRAGEAALPQSGVANSG